MEEVKFVGTFMRALGQRPDMRAGGRELDNPNTYNQTIKFDQLIEYTMKDIFLKKLIHNVLEKLVPDLFLKNHN